jgi:hypothetical protein
MTSEQVTDIIDKIHEAGYAVIIWTPEELENSGESAKHVEDCLISYGNEYFNIQGGEE